MKLHTMFYTFPFLLACSACTSNPNFQASPADQNNQSQPGGYAITDLGPMDSPFSQATWLNNSGAVTGISLAPDGTQHAVLWSNGILRDLSQPGLGGPNSGAFAINQAGQVVGEAETSTLDPNNENSCGYGTGLQCLAVVWQNGAMKPLEPLGGTNSVVSMINSRGEIVGLAETASKDPECPTGVLPNGTGPLQFDYEAVIWGPDPGQIRELSPEAGDTVGVAMGINDAGQVVGVSGRCGDTVTPGFVAGPHAVMWDRDGMVYDLGSFGGTSNLAIPAVGNAAVAINNSGEIVGTSAMPGSLVNQPFDWTSKKGMRHLQLLAGDVVGAGLDINNNGAVVGASITEGGPATGTPKAVIWQNGADGPVTDLNNYAAGSAFDGGLLLTAYSINDSGEISGFGITSGGEIHGFVARPCNEKSTGCLKSALTVSSARSNVKLTEDARRIFIRSGMRGH